MKSVTYSLHGSSFEVDPVISTKDFSRLMTNGSDTVNMVIKGVIKEVCSKKGCWMRLPLTGEEDLMVRFKDYGFFVPKTGIEGKHILMSGNIFRDTISVERLRHYAEDAKKSKEEIELITDPKFKINMIANAVAIRDN